MGNRFQITVVADDEVYATSCIDKAVNEIKRIEELLSTYKASSQTNLINQHAGVKPVNVSDEVFQLKISLLGSDPEIWRTIQISSAATLSRLHKAIQSAFDWEATKKAEIESLTTLEELDAYVIVPKKEFGFPLI